MAEKLLEIKDLHVTASGREILQGLNLTVNKGEVHVLLGPNGAGKSTLVNTIMGHPQYQVTGGQIFFEGKEITHAKTDERARLGLFLSFQSPQAIPGVSVENFLRTSYGALTQKPVKIFAFKKELSATMKELSMDESYAERDLNVGFSGGERKKNEILQMLMLHPKLAILDETDSGLDVDAVKIVSQGVEKYKNGENALLIITHNTKILEYLKVTSAHVLIDGKIVKSGGPELVNEVNTSGFASLNGAVCGESG